MGDGCSFSFPRAGGLLSVRSVVLPAGAVVGRPGHQVTRLHEPRAGPHVGSCEHGAQLCCVAVVVLAKPHEHREWAPSSCSWSLPRGRVALLSGSCKIHVRCKIHGNDSVHRPGFVPNRQWCKHVIVSLMSEK